MRHIVSFFIAVLYALGLGFSDPSKPSAPLMKIKVEHTHEVAEGHHHHHDFANDGELDDEHNENHHHDKNAEHKHSIPHSHEVSISMSGGCVLSSGSIVSVNISVKSGKTVSTVYSETPPKEISLSSIFRPPIA